jgi:ribosomal protein S18 acetylase RimI-like enzyme
MHIRLLTEHDWQTWKALRLEALKNVPEAFYSSYEEESTLADEVFREILQNNAIFGAFDGDMLIGCMAMGIFAGFKRKHQGVVWSTYVKPQYRGKKVGDALLEAVINHAKTTVKQLQLSAHTENQSALRLYQRHGFEVYGTEPRAIKIGDRFYDECLMMQVFDK